VDVRVDQPRHEHRVAGIVNGYARANVARVADGGDPSIANVNRGGAKRPIDEHALAAQHELAHR
jgi:hypothetical protein